MNNVKRARRTPRRKPSQAANGRTAKPYAVLCMYDALLGGEYLTVADGCIKFGISVPTFRRYIAALKKHLGERCGLRLRYDRAGKAYGIAER